jgi:two-component system, LytTR family, response regulator
MPAVVFVTAFDHYALAAFEVHALDYLLKPFNRKRFDMTVARARRHLVHSGDSRLRGLLQELKTPAAYLTRFVVRANDRIRLIESAQVDWIEAADNYALLHAGADTHAVRDTMNRLAEVLDPERFVRIHRSTIVRLDRIRELQPTSHGDFIALLHDDTRLSGSRAYNDLLRQKPQPRGPLGP